MQTSATIVDRQGGNFIPWQVESCLWSPTINEVRLSLGFLRCNPADWFPDLGSKWFPLFHAHGIDVLLRDVKTSLHFPDDLERIAPIEIDGEAGVFGISSQAEMMIAQALAPECEGTGLQVLIEYLQRRLIATLQLSWFSGELLECFFVPSEGTEEVEVVGAIELSLEINNFPLSIWFGIGPRFLERLDSISRQHFIPLHLDKGLLEERFNDNDIVTLTVELAELSIPPALLIDYIRSDTLVCLDTNLSDAVIIKVEGESWARGRVCQFRGRFGVQITTFENQTSYLKKSQSEGMTRVGIEVAQTELDVVTLKEHAQKGAIVLTKTPLHFSARLVIAGEQIANAVVGESDGKMALSILPK